MAADPVMASAANGMGRIAATSRQFARLLLTIGENRLELLNVAVQEERALLLGAILLALGMGVLGLLAGISLTAALVVYLRAYVSPAIVLLALTALYGVAGLILYGRFKRRLRNGHAFSPLLDQLHKDRACVEDNLP